MIRQERQFDADKHKLFDALTNSETFSAATGAEANINPEEGGAFTCFNEQIKGRFLHVARGEQIVQAWRAEAWPPGVFSIVALSLSEQDGVTTLTLEQSSTPKNSESHLEQGWDNMYWTPLKAYFQ